MSTQDSSWIEVRSGRNYLSANTRDSNDVARSSRRKSNINLQPPAQLKKPEHNRSHSAPGGLNVISKGGRRKSSQNGPRPNNLSPHHSPSPNRSSGRRTPGRTTPNTARYSPRYWYEALITGHEDRVRTFLRQGAEVNGVLETHDIPPTTPLNIKLEDGLTPIEVAAAGGWSHVVTLLLKVGASLDLLDRALKIAYRAKPQTAQLRGRKDSEAILRRYQHTDNVLRLWHWIRENEGRKLADLRTARMEMPTNLLPEVLSCQWEVYEAVKRACDSNGTFWEPECLRRFIAITGQNGEYEALPVEEYVKREWGDVGVEFLDTLVEAIGLAEPSYVHSHDNQATSKHIRAIKATTKEVVIVCKDTTPPETIADIAECLTWLCETVRLAPTDQLHASCTTVQLIRSPIDPIEVVDKPLFNVISQRSFAPSSIKVNIVLSTLTTFEESQDICWTPLFSCAVISARSTQSRPKGFGRGLEASFELLKQITAVEIVTPIDQGVVFVGYDTILVPYAFRTGYGKTSDCLQFHLEYKPPATHCQVNPFITRPQRVLSSVEYTIDSNTRCFLGWCAQGTINLGTDRIQHNPRYSSSKEKPQTLHLQGFSFGGQLVSAGPVQGGGTVAANFGYVSNVLRFTPNSSYPRILSDTGILETAVIVDVATKRAWMVPKLSVLLHMAQCWARERDTVVLPNSIPTITPYSDGHELVRFLLDKGDTVIINDGNTPFLLRTLLLGLNTSLLKAVEVQEKTRVWKAPFHGGEIFGFEFMDIVNEPGKGANMREVKVKTEVNGWLRLCNQTDAVIICSDIGEVITPVCEKTTVVINTSSTSPTKSTNSQPSSQHSHSTSTDSQSYHSARSDSTGSMNGLPGYTPAPTSNPSTNNTTQATTITTVIRPCIACNYLPDNNYILAAPISCLKRITDRTISSSSFPNNNSTNNLSTSPPSLPPLIPTTSRPQSPSRLQSSDDKDGMFWHLTGQPFLPCPHVNGSKTNCWERDDLFQSIVKREKGGRARSLSRGRSSGGGKENEKTVNGGGGGGLGGSMVEDLPSQGIVVFGRSMGRKR